MQRKAGTPSCYSRAVQLTSFRMDLFWLRGMRRDAPDAVRSQQMSYAHEAALRAARWERQPQVEASPSGAHLSVNADIGRAVSCVWASLWASES